MAHDEEFTQADADWWHKRGVEDSLNDKAPLFRNTRNKGIHAVAETPEHWSYEYERQAGAHYLEGFND